MLRHHRRRAGLSQRALAEKAQVPQSTVARIESGAMDPKASTLRKLLRTCGADLESLPALGHGIDRTQIRERLKMTPDQRVQAGVASWHALAPVRAVAGRKRR